MPALRHHEIPVKQRPDTGSAQKATDNAESPRLLQTPSPMIGTGCLQSPDTSQDDDEALVIGNCDRKFLGTKVYKWNDPSLVKLLCSVIRKMMVSQ